MSTNWNVSKAFGETQVLRGLSERFAQGEAVCVMGRSGLGKTTLASIVMGLEKPDAGAVRGAKGKRFAVAFQEDRLVERLSAQGNLRFACGAALDEPRMAEAIVAVGLTPQDVEKPVGELSGGQRRRVALLGPGVSADGGADERSGLDEAAQAAAAYVRRMQAGRTLLCITHEEGDAALLGAWCSAAGGGGTAGRTIRKGRSRDKRLRPFNAWTTRFLNLSERCGTRRQARNKNNAIRPSARGCPVLLGENFHCEQQKIALRQENTTVTKRYSVFYWRFPL
ncbi:MAG: ATP-binding cassette domain-containing protein [Ruthenibacterium lactatiformans]